MEEAPDNGKESLCSAHANGMNEQMKNIFNVTAVKSERQTLVQGLHILYSVLRRAERWINV
jgi:hypothetical protein